MGRCFTFGTMYVYRKLESLLDFPQLIHYHVNGMYMLYIYAHTYTCMQAVMHWHMCIWGHKHITHMYVSIYVCMNVQMYVNVYMLYQCIYLAIDISKIQESAYRHTYMYIHTYTYHMHTYMCMYAYRHICI